MSHALPIDALLPEIIESLRGGSNLVIEAAPGAGKTTRVPPALLELVTGEVLVLEPRRIAARLAARRVAAEMGEEVGGTVGYQVRFEEVSGPKTRLRFVTEGVLTRRMLRDADLRVVDAVVLDEFHERHLDTDLALALLKRLQQRRPELRIVVMSATLDAGPVAEYLGGCRTVRSEGRAFPLTVQYTPYSSLPLAAQVKGAVELLVREKHVGHTLVFLPGVAEIHRATRECEAATRAAGWMVLPLHGELSPAEQDKAVGPSDKPKLILATNVAESSVTVEGVNAVIDSGLARVAAYSPWSGLPTLEVRRVSKASAKQRAGRAGRTGPGRVLRLYAEEDFARRPEHDTPEILRSDLSQLCLAMRVMGLEHVRELQWLDEPPAAAVEHAEGLLDRLGATSHAAEELARYPLAPRLARILVEALRRGVGEDGCLAVAILSAGARSDKSDLLAAMDLPQDARTDQTARQLRRIAKPPKQSGHDDDALLMSVLAGFPDRVAKRKAGKLMMLANGVAAEVSGEVPQYEFMVALDAEDRKDKPMPLVRITSRVEPEWLIDLFPDRVREQSVLTWNRSAERVDATSRMTYDELVLNESRDATPDESAVAQMLAHKAMEVGVERFIDRDDLENFSARVLFAGFGELDVEAELRALCLGLKSFAELKVAAKGLLSLIEQRMDTQRLRELAPSTIKLKKGPVTKVRYERGKPPWMEARLQEFFGMKETPRIGPESTPVVVHLLAPNRRAVQMTSDLAGFWERLYPTVRKELMRRYPKHQWPEKPI